MFNIFTQITPLERIAMIHSAFDNKLITTYSEPIGKETLEDFESVRTFYASAIECALAAYDRIRELEK